MTMVQQTNGKVLPDLQAQLAALRAENDALKAAATAKQALRVKRGEKGGVSVYGLNVRFPVTLYASQWERLITFIPQVAQFIKDNPDLTRKV